MAAVQNWASWRHSRTRSDEKHNWSKQVALELIEKVKLEASRMSRLQEPPRILLVGKTGSGKSSFISSILSALSDDVTFSSMIGEMQEREENTSKRYLEYRMFMGESKEPLNFILCDAGGIGKKNQLGVSDREIQRLMDGKLRHGDLMDSKGGIDQALIDKRVTKPPSGVVFVQNAQCLGEVDEAEDVQEKLNKAADIAKGRGIPCSVILTHIDVVKPSLANKLHRTLDNLTLKECVKSAAKKFGVTTNCVFLVKNYTNETRKHVRQDILILRALHEILVDVSYPQRFDAGEMMKQISDSFTEGSTQHHKTVTLIDSSPALHHRPRIVSEPDVRTLGSSERFTHSFTAYVVKTKPKPKWSQDEPVPKSHWRSFSGEKVSEGVIFKDLFTHKVHGRSHSFTEGSTHHHKTVTVIDSPALCYCPGIVSEPDVRTSVSVQSFRDIGIVDVVKTKPKSKWSQDKPIPKSPWRRGQKFYEGVIPKNLPSQKLYRRSDSDAECDGLDRKEAGSDKSSEDADYHRQEPGLDKSSGIDDGVGQSIDSFEKDLKHSCSRYLTDIISALVKAPYPGAYGEDARLRGAKPLFQPTVRQITNARNTSTDSDRELALQLIKNFSNEPSLPKLVHETLKQLCGTETGGSLWMSYTLPTDLGLPQDSLSPKSTHIQLFFLSSGQPPFLLTLYDLKIKEDVSTFGEWGIAQTEAFHVHSKLFLPGTSRGRYETPTKESDVDMVNHEEEVENVKLYTLQLGKLLTTALLNFCCCDFLLLPLCISVAEFDLLALQKGLQQQMTLARQFYRGPLELSTSSYRELKAAATAVTGVSSVPRLMTAGVEKDKQLVLMDTDWRAVVSLLVETLTENKVTDLTYPPEAALKTQVAVVEAAKRLSFVYRVLLFTPRSQLRDSCGKLKLEAAEDTGVDLKLTVLSPDDRIESGNVKYVIRLDCPSDYMWDETECKVLRVSQATTTKSTKEIRV